MNDLKARTAIGAGSGLTGAILALLIQMMVTPAVEALTRDDVGEMITARAPYAVDREFIRSNIEDLRQRVAAAESKASEMKALTVKVDHALEGIRRIEKRLEER